MYDFKTVKLNSTGPSVIALQSLFRAMQYRGADGKPLEITGVATADTVKAINEFQSIQRAYGYECGTNGKNDGSFGPACWRRILGV